MHVRTLVMVLSLFVAGLSPIIAGSSIAATDVAGVPAENVGLHGPIANHLENLELVGHTPIPNVDGVPLGNNGAVALLDDCAFVSRWHDYSGRNPIQIVDISDPSAPTVAGAVPDSVNAGGVAREIRVYDDGHAPGWSDPFGIPDMLVVLEFSSALGNRTNNALHLFTFEGPGDCTRPVLAGSFNMRTFRGHEFFLWVDPWEDALPGGACISGCPRLLAFVTAPIGPPNVLVIDVSRPDAPSLVGTYDAAQPVVSTTEVEGTALGNYAHSISLSPDGSIAYLSYWDGGFFSMDARALAKDFVGGGTLLPRGAASIPYDYSGPEGDAYGNTHSAVPIPGQNAVVVGDEIYISTDGCPFGWMRVLDVGDETTAPSQIGEFRLDENRPENCITVDPGDPVLGGSHRAANVRNSAGSLIDGTFSMHNQTVGENFVYTSWYGGGLRVIDVSDPTDPVEAGAFVPAPVATTATVPATSAPTYGVDADPNNDWWVQMWSYPVIRDGLIYVTDVRNGLYILRPTDDAPFAGEVAGIGFLEGNSNIGDPASTVGPPDPIS